MPDIRMRCSVPRLQEGVYEEFLSFYPVYIPPFFLLLRYIKNDPNIWNHKMHNTDGSGSVDGKPSEKRD